MQVFASLFGVCDTILAKLKSCATPTIQFSKRKQNFANKIYFLIRIDAVGREKNKNKNGTIFAAITV